MKKLLPGDNIHPIRFVLFLFSFLAPITMLIGLLIFFDTYYACYHLTNQLQKEGITIDAKVSRVSNDRYISVTYDTNTVIKQLKKKPAPPYQLKGHLSISGRYYSRAVTDKLVKGQKISIIVDQELNDALLPHNFGTFQFYLGVPNLQASVVMFLISFIILILEPRILYLSIGATSDKDYFKKIYND